MAILSAFADEVTEDFRGQLDFLEREQVGHIELRFLDQKNIIELSQAQRQEVRLMLRGSGVGVSAIGSPVGKVRVDDATDRHMDWFKRAVDLADFFGTNLIRVFSYYPPPGERIEAYRERVLDRIRAKIQVVEGTPFVMVHENETGIYGHSAENCVDLATTLNSPHFRLTYDPGNFVWGQKITDNVQRCWPVMKPYVAHVHIKDWKLGADLGSIPGEGDGQIAALLTELAGVGYEGSLTMEPHLQKGGRFGGATDADLFAKSIAAIRKLAGKVGLKLQ